MNGYFDYNATTPLLPVAQEAWIEASAKHWHNASGLYREGGFTRRKLEEARERLGERLGCEPERIVFTSGATESNNALFHSLALSHAGSTVLSSAIEHPSVREPLQAAFAQRTELLSTQSSGCVDLDDLAEKLKKAPRALVTTMAANNECGALQPWREMLALCRNAGVPFHTDASQWIGKLSAQELGECDYITGSGHKFGGPKGIGFLVMKNENEALRFMRGGPQEEGRRAGTENYPSVEAMVTALEGLTPQLSGIASTQSSYRQQFIAALREQLGAVRVIAEESERLWNTVMFVTPRHDNRKWLARLSQRGFQVSNGSACSALKDGSSTVLAALGASPDDMRQVLRVSSGWSTELSDWLALAQAMKQVLNELDQ